MECMRAVASAGKSSSLAIALLRYKIAYKIVQNIQKYHMKKV